MDRRVRLVEEAPVEAPKPGDVLLEHRPVVIGAGPAGLFAALILARAGYRPHIVERGARMNHRVRDIEAFHRRQELALESNYLFGEGGAGTFSDGKLTCRSKDPRVRLVLDEFRRASGMEVVKYYYRPHLGSDRIRAVVGRLRREIESLGGEFTYDVRVKHIASKDGRVHGLETTDGAIPAEVCICAPGHSARDFYEDLLATGIRLQQKPFQMGFRVEHPQELIDNWMYGGLDRAKDLGPADYRLVARVGDDRVFSFCMCPGGEIIPAVHDRAHFNTNGMSYFTKDTGFANSGFVTTIEPSDFGDAHPLAGIRLQQMFEERAARVAGDRYELPAQRLDDFLANRESRDVPRTSCRTGRRPARVRDFAPAFVTARIVKAMSVFDRQIPGFVGPEAVICGPEARSSAPVRIERDAETHEAIGLAGLYPVGEGAGHAGGIVSAAVDGWRAAESIIRQFGPLLR